MNRLTGYQLNAMIREGRRRPLNYRFPIKVMVWGLFCMAVFVWSDELVVFIKTL
ncbi:MAG: hypothetical protein KAR40_11330 [Candidatus Sabulitectum sp.]|nr:hypothetical protein [Candidatus Sabulitectum sp.]